MNINIEFQQVLMKFWDHWLWTRVEKLYVPTWALLSRQPQITSTRRDLKGNSAPVLGRLSPVQWRVAQLYKKNVLKMLRTFVVAFISVGQTALKVLDSCVCITVWVLYCILSPKHVFGFILSCMSTVIYWVVCILNFCEDCSSCHLARSYFVIS